MTLTTDKDYKEAYVGKIISDGPARVVNQGRSIDNGGEAYRRAGSSFADNRNGFAALGRR